MKQIRLGKSLSIFFAISIIFPLIIISIFAMSYSTSFLSELSKQNNLQIADTLKISVERFFLEPENDLGLLRDLLLREDLSNQNAVVNESLFEIYHNNQDKFHHYQILNPDGFSIYSYPENYANVGFDLSASENYKAISSGHEKYWSQTYVDRRFGQTSIDFALPLRDHILVGTIQLESLNKVINEIIQKHDLIIGITDNTGTYILHSNYRNVEQRITDPFVNRQRLNYDYVHLSNDDYYGTNIKSNYQNWNIVLYEHVSHLQDTTVQFSIILILIILTFTSLVILLGNKFKTLIIDNLSAFVSRTKNIADGDYSRRIMKSHFVEFNEIGQHFTQMADRIKSRELKITDQKEEIELMNRDLENRVHQRTQELVKTNEMLENTLENLNSTREQLIESEKLASLGNLVAGLAHELNTPLGIILTVVTYMQEATEKITDKLHSGTLKKDELVKYNKSMAESESLIYDNVTRTTDLVSSFKLISSDQMIHEVRTIDLHDYIENIVRGLEPGLKKKHVQIQLNPSEHIEIKTIPGSIYQVMVNLIMNAALHAYDSDGGLIEIDINDSNEDVEILVKDYGKGISEDNLKRIYEPFFTTKRGQGGTGLGLNITYNAVKQSLKGSISAKSELGIGTHMTVTLPRDIQEAIG